MSAAHTDPRTATGMPTSADTVTADADEDEHEAVRLAGPDATATSGRVEQSGARREGGAGRPSTAYYTLPGR